jgi:hypothetical protein
MWATWISCAKWPTAPAANDAGGAKNRHTVAAGAQSKHVNRSGSVALDTPEVTNTSLRVLHGFENPVELDRARRDDLNDEQRFRRIDPNRSPRWHRAADMPRSSWSFPLARHPRAA